MRIRRRFFVAILVLAVVLSVLSLAGFTLYRNATIAQEGAELEQASGTIASQVDVVLDEKAQMVSLWTRTPALADHGSPAQSREVRSFVTATDFSGASVIAANGTMTAFYSRGTNASQSRALVGESFETRTYFRRAMAGEVYVSEPVAAESGNLIVTVSAPIRSDGRIVGTLNAAFHVLAGDLFDSIRARDTGEEGILVLAGGETIYTDGPRPGQESALAVANATVERTGWTVSVTRTDAAIQSQLRTITLL
jgi:C4-dicarboxylate-specific signal transduction histidine kinase